MYSAVTWAPLAGLSENGLRVRMGGGYGAYRYSALRPVGGTGQLINFEGSVSFADLLVGYQHQFGPVTAKLYAGAMGERRGVDPVDPEALAHGAGIGGKAVLETWWTIGERAWASLDLSYGTLHDSYSSRLRGGWRVLSSLSIGPEFSAAGNTDGDIGRAGAFVRYEWAAGEISASGGLMMDWGNIDRVETDAAFAIISWKSRF